VEDRLAVEDALQARAATWWALRRRTHLIPTTGDRHGRSAHVDRQAGIDPPAGGRGIMSRHRLGVMLFLIAAFASFLLSIALWFTDHREEGVFVGLWVPSILAAGGFWMAAVRTQ
jgi:hypothetical protein